MNFFEILVIGLILFLIIFTFIQEPVVSIKYGKAMFKSVLKVIQWGFDVVKENASKTSMHNSTIGLNETKTFI